MKVEKKDKAFAFLFGALVGLVLFYKIYGYGVIGITNVEWLLSGGDLTRSYLGWVSYRNSPWHFPLWLTDNLITGESVSILYTGSAPLLAIIFKLFRSILPVHFQYFGLYGLLCFILQSLFDGCKQIVVGFKRGVLRIIALDGLGRTEQKSCL